MAQGGLGWEDPSRRAAAVRSLASESVYSVCGIDVRCSVVVQLPLERGGGTTNEGGREGVLLPETPTYIPTYAQSAINLIKYKISRAESGGRVT